MRIGGGRLTGRCLQLKPKEDLGLACLTRHAGKPRLLHPLRFAIGIASGFRGQIRVVPVHQQLGAVEYRLTLLGCTNEVRE